MKSRRSAWLKLFALLLATLLPVSICLPWFELPIMGWTVPVPAWNRAGFFCLLVASAHLLRALGGSRFRWLQRASLLPAFYYWWTSVQSVQVWGAKHLAPAQLKLSGLNHALTSLGADRITLYEGPLWRGLEPQLGWHLTGAALVASLLLTALDGHISRVCKECKLTLGEDDGFCFSCGAAQRSTPSCANCGSQAGLRDQFCRDCGSKMDQSPS